MAHFDTEDILTWCIWPWEFLVFEEMGGYECGAVELEEPVLQVLTFAVNEGELPSELLSEFHSNDTVADEWSIDFSRQIPTEESLEDHADCGEFFSLWGTHSHPELIDILHDKNLLKVAFLTTTFPADGWAEFLSDKYPQVETKFEYKSDAWEGHFIAHHGKILWREHDEL